MRWICLAGLLIAVALAAPALAGHHHQWAAYSMGYGVPCPVPCLAPGCCEHQTSCCENVWAGFCQEKARFHHKSCGARKACVCETGCDCVGAEGGPPAGPAVPKAAAPTVAPAPTPASPPAAPVPKTTRSGTRSRWPG